MVWDLGLRVQGSGFRVHGVLVYGESTFPGGGGRYVKGVDSTVCVGGEGGGFEIKRANSRAYFRFRFPDFYTMQNALLGRAKGTLEASSEVLGSVR